MTHPKGKPVTQITELLREVWQRGVPDVSDTAICVGNGAGELMVRIGQALAMQSTSPPVGPNTERDLAWGKNAIAFIRERGLEVAFNDWCGGWPCPTVTPPPVTDEVERHVAALDARKEELEVMGDEVNEPAKAQAEYEALSAAIASLTRSDALAKNTDSPPPLGEMG